jgi:hypothetical protein
MEIRGVLEREIAAVYNKRFEIYGPELEASLWFCRNRQLARFEMIAKHIFRKKLKLMFRSVTLVAVTVASQNF